MASVENQNGTHERTPTEAYREAAETLAFLVGNLPQVLRGRARLAQEAYEALSSGPRPPLAEGEPDPLAAGLGLRTLSELLESTAAELENLLKRSRPITR